MRVAVIGAGSIGTRHIGNLIGLGCDVEVYEPHPDRLRQTLERFPQVREGGNEAPDAVVIATPYDTHLAFAQDCAATRTPMFIEKPLGTLAELDAWRQLADEAGDLVTQVGYQNRFQPIVRVMRSITPEQGLFITRCESKTWPGGAYGPFLLEASHDIDLALHLGAPATVTRAASRGPALDIRLGEGDRWGVQLVDRSPVYERTWTVSQRAHSITASFADPAALGGQVYIDEMQHFIACVADGRQTDVPLRDGVRVLEVCAAVEARVTTVNRPRLMQ